MQGFLTLFRKELMRFCKVGLQTIAAPMLSALLYLLIFSHALSGHVAIYPGVAYTSFLVPGLVMMALMQNAFGNSSSSLIQSKVSGNLVFVLLAPLTPLAMYGGYVLSAMVRGIVVGAGVLLVACCFVDVPMRHPLWMLLFALGASGILGTLGLVAAIWAEKFDQIASFQNFLVVPLTFLSGVFYSVHSLPPFWQRPRTPIRSSTWWTVSAMPSSGRPTSIRGCRWASWRRRGCCWRCWPCGCCIAGITCVTEHSVNGAGVFVAPVQYDVLQASGL